MADITMVQWAAGTSDNDVSDVLTAITLPAGLTPAEFLYKALAAYRAAQETYNTANPNAQITAVSLPSTGSVQADASGNYSFLSSYTFTVQVPVTYDAAVAAPA